MKKIISVLFCAAALQACVSTSEDASLVPTDLPVVSDSSSLKKSVSVSQLPKESSGSFKNQVSDESLASALKAALSKNNMLADGTGTIIIVPSLINLKQPAVGLDMEVTATVNYIVKDAAGKTVMDETVSTPYTADFSDAFVGLTRVRMANEGAVRNNITEFINRLIVWNNNQAVAILDNKNLSVMVGQLL